MKCKFLSFFILFNLFNIILMLNIFLFVYNWFESPFHFRLKFGAPISTALKNGYLPIPLMVGQPFFQLNYLLTCHKTETGFTVKKGGGVMRQEKGFLYLCEEWSLFPKEGWCIGHREEKVGVLIGGRGGKEEKVHVFGSVLVFVGEGGCWFYPVGVYGTMVNLWCLIS